MKIALFGTGKTGQFVAPLAKEQGHTLVASFNRTTLPSLSLIKECDVCIDFSHASCVLDHLKLAARAGKPMVIGTTGWESQLSDAEQIVSEAQTAAVYSPNFSLGVTLFLALLSQASQLFTNEIGYDTACLETHHKQKQDIPSGTAKAIREIMGKNLPISSIRLGHMPGTHTVIFDSPLDSITLTHETRHRESFAKGAIRAAEWIINKKGWWTFHDLVRSIYSDHHSL